MKKVGFIVIGLILIFLSYRFFYIKWLGYESVPNTTIFDERDYPFVGYSFRTTGIPTGWSTMNIYKILQDKQPKSKIDFDGTSIVINDHKPNLFNKDLFNYPVTGVIDVDIGRGKETIRIVQPFFDHPIFGSWLYSLGIKNNPKSFDDLKPADFRKVSLYLSVITGILIFIFSYLIYYDLIISFLAFFIYSTVTSFVLMSRYSLLENIIIPVSLLVLSLIIYFVNNHKSNKFVDYFLMISSGFFSGIAFITKESGIFIILTVLIILVKNKTSFKKILAYLIPLIIISAVYYFYMYYLSPILFFKLLFDQTNRDFFGPLSFLYSITQPNFSLFPKEGYWIFGLISLFSICFKDLKKHFYLFLPFVSYLFIFLFLGGLNYPWYYLPCLPFLIIASAFFIRQIIISPNIVSLVLFYLLPFLSSFYWGYFVYNKDVNNYFVFRFSLLIFILMFLLQKFIYHPLIKFFWVIFIFLIFYQINKWNFQGFQYIINNWGHLSPNFSFPL